MPLPLNDPFIEAIAERIRAVVGRQPFTVTVLARILDVSPDALSRLIEPQRVIDPALVTDVVAALVGEFAVDPHWLLTGEYDGAVHRHALLLGEDRTPGGMRTLHQFVHQQYERLRHARMFLSLPPTMPN